MADVAEEVIETVKNVVNQVAENLTNTDGEEISGKKVPSTPEGMAVAYISLVTMALLPIFFGSYRSVKYQTKQKESNEKPETMTSKDAMMFPLIASCSLFGIYLVFKIFSKDHINLLLTGYFFLLGVMALTHLLTPFCSPLMPKSFPLVPYHLLFVRGEGKNKEALIDFKFTTHDVACFIMSTVIGVWYLMKKHWIANNLLGIAFAVNGVELLHLNNIVTGCILLSGLFIYDIFWVFGTNVMVTVAKSFDAPIKLLFPQDILEHGVNASNFAMLGLGDIVIPGIFIALLLRFDVSLKRKSHAYFNATFLAYFLGLLTTIFIMHVFKHAQPALLYLVPACMSAPFLLALCKGDIKTLIAYEDHPEEKEKKQKSNKKDKSAEKQQEAVTNEKSEKAENKKNKKESKKAK
ncbi:minor histocompatibility antigen H13 [Culicoides brevitarsis]|uniref:minor histocompatibility antigen H13 n=1 Tax=Culicoides brevitarsis TaxID=469753 RepID=UPI00307B3B85